MSDRLQWQLEQEAVEQIRLLREDDPRGGPKLDTALRLSMAISLKRIADNMSSQVVLKEPSIQVSMSDIADLGRREQ